MSLPPPEEKRAFVSRMFDAIAPRYDAMNRLMTFGMDRGWRRATLASLAIRPGHVIVDLGCGTGDLSDGARTAGARAVGVDLSAGMLAQATRRGSAGTLVRADAGKLPLADSSCDGAVSGFALRNFESVETVIRECARVVRGAVHVLLSAHRAVRRWFGLARLRVSLPRRLDGVLAAVAGAVVDARARGVFERPQAVDGGRQHSARHRGASELGLTQARGGSMIP